MFEGLSDWDLIEVMGEATRDESTAIAQRPRGRPRTTTSWPRKPSERWASWRPASARYGTASHPQVCPKWRAPVWN